MRYLMLIYFVFICYNALPQSNGDSSFIPPTIIEPENISIISGDTLFVHTNFFVSDTVIGRLWLNLFLDSNGNCLSYAILAFDNFKTGVREDYSDYYAIDLYKDSSMLNKYYPNYIIQIYNSLRVPLNMVDIKKNKKQKTKIGFESITFYVMLKNRV